MDRGIGARLETAVLVWIVLGTMLIVGLIVAFGWPWTPVHVTPQPVPAAHSAVVLL